MAMLAPVVYNEVCVWAYSHVDVAIQSLIQYYQYYKTVQRLGQNSEAGLEFQRQALQSMGLPQNYQTVTGTFIRNGVQQVGKSIPDAMTDAMIVEIKNTASV